MDLFDVIMDEEVRKESTGIDSFVVIFCTHVYQANLNY